jgi:beta-glucosidase
MKYISPPYFAEGVDETDNPRLPLKEALIDNQRIDYFHQHLSFVQKAIK